MHFGNHLCDWNSLCHLNYFHFLDYSHIQTGLPAILHVHLGWLVACLILCGD